MHFTSMEHKAGTPIWQQDRAIRSKRRLHVLCIEDMLPKPGQDSTG